MFILAKFMSFLEGYREIILLIHEKPDGDCLGSALALGHYLNNIGFQARIYHPERIEIGYDFLPGQEMIHIYTEQELPSGRPIIAVDCADIARLLYSLPTDVPIINIDHHSSNTYFGILNIVDPQAAATGEMIFELLREAVSEISPVIASCLYVALSADTGSFRYSNTTAKTFRIAGELLDSGAEIELIREHLFERRPLLELLMIRLSLTHLQFALSKKIIWTVLSYQELREADLLNTDTESVISLLRSVEGVEVALVFKELEPQKIKISFRAKKSCNVNLLAAEFGGGGHPQAAGCSIEGDLNEIVQQVIQETENRLNEYLAGDGEILVRCL